MTGNILRQAPAAIAVLLVFVIVAVLPVVPDIMAADLDPAIQKITSYTFGASREPLSAVEDMVRSSYGKSSERLRIEKQFASVLTSDATVECKEFICRQLYIIGTKESVPALGKLLMDDKTSDMARYALQRNTCPEAGKALRDGLKKAKGGVLVGIINSLGERCDQECVDELARFISDFAALHPNEDKEKDDKEAMKAMHEARDAAIASINALAKIGGDKAVKTIAEARHIGCPGVKKAAADALLLWGDNLVGSSERVRK